MKLNKVLLIKEFLTGDEAIEYLGGLLGQKITPENLLDLVKDRNIFAYERSGNGKASEIDLTQFDKEWGQLGEIKAFYLDCIKDGNYVAGLNSACFNIHRSSKTAKEVLKLSSRGKLLGMVGYEDVLAALINGRYPLESTPAYFKRADLETLAYRLNNPNLPSLEELQAEIKQLKQQATTETEPQKSALLIIAKAFEYYKKDKPNGTQASFFDDVVDEPNIHGLSKRSFDGLISRARAQLKDARKG